MFKCNFLLELGGQQTSQFAVNTGENKESYVKSVWTIHAVVGDEIKMQSPFFASPYLAFL